MTANRTVDWCTKMTTKSSLFKLFMCFTCELLVPACSHDSCYRYSYEEVLVSRDTCRVSDKNRLKHLATSMKFWKSSSQVLSKTFPLDPQKKNFVREVRNVVFSVTKPTALKTKVRLATFSRMALEEILDMDSQQITRDTEFLQVIVRSPFRANHIVVEWYGSLGQMSLSPLCPPSPIFVPLPPCLSPLLHVCLPPVGLSPPGNHFCWR